jgi:hypothetical protein
METYETTTTVGDQGLVRLADVPFAPGTQVEVSIVPTQPENPQTARTPATAGETADKTADDIFAEMQPYMVDVDDVDDSREAIYTPLAGE